MQMVQVPAGAARMAARMAVREVPCRRADAPHLVFAHGWGQSGAAMLGIAGGLSAFARSTVLDFPGFGASPPPPGEWGTADYADAMADWLRGLQPARRIWIGHSFGCRVGLQLAARHPALLHGMVLIAAAGLKRRRTRVERLRLWGRVRLFKAMKRFVRDEAALERLRRRFGSADYANAGPLRPILMKVLAEDLADVAPGVGCPTLLIYGSLDVDTPPEIGERLAALIPQASLTVLDGFTHNSILSDGQEQVKMEIMKFLRGLE